MKNFRISITIMIIFLLTFLGACSNQTSKNENSNNGSSDKGSGKLPEIISMTSYDVGSTGYIQAAGIASIFKEKESKTLRVIPSGNDVARLSPVRNGSVHFALTGASVYQAQEGTIDFASYEWGPQPVRLVWMSLADTGASLAVAGDSGIESIKDLKGKRVEHIPGAPAINVPIEAYLAFGGLTPDDVELVEFPSHGAALEALKTGQVDAVYTLNDAGAIIEQEASKAGVKLLELPASDAAGWERFHEIWPVITPKKATAGVGASPEKPIEIGQYPYPILTAYDSLDDELVYQMTKMIHENYDSYKDIHPGLIGWDVERQNLTWLVPFHKGAIKYLEEIGKWSEEAEKHNNKLLDKQKALIEGFEKASAEASEKGISSSDFTEYWTQKYNKIAADFQ